MRAVLVGMVLGHLVALSGCYEPQLRNCTVACTGEGQCAAGHICTGDGYCAAPGIASCREYVATLDAAIVATDATTTDVPPDARDLCTQGCSNGTCIDGVCVIDCSTAGSCQGDIACPANLPCRVECGDDACGRKINCTQSTSCTVTCSGDQSCKDEIQCPPGDPCNVTCSGESSCKRRVKCKDSCSCDVTCSGLGSCSEPSECPSALCRVGNACTSSVLGCETCN